jgi:hypothetical protein
MTMVIASTLHCQVGPFLAEVPVFRKEKLPREEVRQMGSKKTTGMALLVAGIVILILSLVANSIGLGNPSVFGPLQIAGAIVGAIAAAVGLFLTLKK